MHHDAEMPAPPHEQRIAQLEQELATAKSELADARGSLAKLREAYARALEQLHLLQRRLFVAKSERADVSAEQLAFDSMFTEIQRLARALDEAESAAADAAAEAAAGTDAAGAEAGAAGAATAGGEDKGKGGGASKPKGKARRNLAEADYPIVRVVIESPELETLGECIGDVTTWRLGYERGGPRRIQIVRRVYKVAEPVGQPTVWRSVATTHGASDGALADVGVAADELVTSDAPPEEMAPRPPGAAPEGDERSASGPVVDAEDATGEVPSRSDATAADRAPSGESVEASVDARVAPSRPEASAAAAPSVETVEASVNVAAQCSSEQTLPSTGACAASAKATPMRTVFLTMPMPKELSRRSFLAPSMIAHILTSKYLLGVPFYRLEQQMALRGVPLDRGTMCRYAEDVGATLGVIVDAARKEAFETAFCLSTDATGVCIQPGPLEDRPGNKRGPCRKGHFFVVLADKDHVFFEYQPKHTSAAVCEMFKGFSRYIQADAHAIYDALFEGRPPKGAPLDEERGPPPIEVGCWSHCRRNFWEAAVCKHELGVEGLRRIDAIFAADRLLADLAPARRKARRDVLVRPLLDAFFTWVKAEHARPRERGLIASALGYAVRQEQPLRRFLEDGRLRLENNASERALRAIAAARKLWLFFGSDDHASAAANLFSLIASCKLHRLDPEAYVADVLRVFPYWPRDRYLELAPKYWAKTRARLRADELTLPLGPVTVPPPLPPQEQRASG